MGKRFRTDHLDQSLLLPPSLHDWLPEGHLARFIADLMDALDLKAIYRSYGGDGRGLAAYQPAMLVRLLLYGYCLGVVSSRKIERATHEDVAFRFLSADSHPDHDTIATFRKRHLEALAGLFVQALRMCEKAGLVKLGHVAIDGTKIKANASKHKAMSYERMNETEQRLRQEVEELLRRAAEVDEAEDAQYGKGKRGDELPAELARRESRLKKIQEAKEKAERQRAEAEAKIAERREQEARTGKKAGGHDPKVPDPDSRIMVDGANKGSFIQAYNAQAAVDSQAQVIVAAEVTQAANGPPPEEASVKEAMRRKLRTEAGQAIYKMRKAIVEPVFGQTKERRGFRRFSFRGMENVCAEWKLICLTNNLLKLFRSGWAPQTA